MAITMGFVISLRRDDILEEPNQRQSTDHLTIINEKLDRVLEEGRARDTVLLQQLLKMQQQNGRSSAMEKFAEAFE